MPDHQIAARPQHGSVLQLAVAALAFLSALLLAGSRADAQLCRSFFGAGLSDAILAEIGPATCEVGWSNEAGLPPFIGRHRIIHPTSWLHDQTATRQQYVEAAAQAVDDAISMLNALGLFRGQSFDTTLLMGADELSAALASSPAAVGDFWPDEAGGSVCPAFSGHWQVTRRFSPDEFKFVIAHELFHCFALWNYNAEISADVDRWWMEGMAHYFAHVLYPTKDVEHRDAPDYSPGLPVFRHNRLSLSYSTVAFFLWLELRGQNGLIFDTMARLDEARDPVYFHELLSGWPDIAPNFHGFAQQFYSEGFVEVTGSRVPIAQPDPLPAEINEVVPDSRGTLEIFAQPFEIHAERFTLDGGRAYDISVGENEVPGRYHVRIASGDWQAMPDSIITRCNEEQDVTVLATSTASPSEVREEPYTLDIELRWEPAGVCACPFDPAPTALILQTPSMCSAEAAIDRCLIGLWSLAPGSYRADLERMVPGSVHSAEAVANIAISESGLAEGCMHASAHISAPSASDGPPVDVKTTMAVTSTHQLSSTDSGELCVTEVRSISSVDSVATVLGQTLRNSTAGSPFPFTLRSDYSCDAENLRLRIYPPGVDYIEHEFIRVD